MSIATTITFLVLIVMQHYMLYPMTWKNAWRYLKSKIGA